MLRNVDKLNLLRASKIALMSDYKNYRLGCVAAIKGKVLSVGWNSNKTHPLQKFYNASRYSNNNQKYSPDKLHAEIHCLASVRNLDVNFDDVIIYVSRVKKDGSHGMARPCSACMTFIKSLGIKRICYTTDDGIAMEAIDGN